MNLLQFMSSLRSLFSSSLQNTKIRIDSDWKMEIGLNSWNKNENVSAITQAIGIAKSSSF